MSKTLTHNSRHGIRNYFLKPLFFVLAFNFSFAQNAIVTENLNAGVPASQWDIPLNSNGTFGDKTIQGFGTDISVNVGGTINFKITITSGTNKSFGIKIYRIGYYQGNGARLIADLGTAFTGITQNACTFDNSTGLTDCGNWTTTASWAVPSTAVSGLYIAKLTRSAAGGGGSSHIAFVVRNDASTSQLLFKTSDATWQAYNPYGGYSLYVGAGMPFNHGNKVSYNRPYLTRDGGGGGGASEDFFMNAEYPMIRFLERNGFDISYTTDVDMARSTSSPVTNHKVFLSTGHDEYWSKEERNTVEAAKAAGKNMAFFSGNEVYWKTRWENSVDGTSTPFRTMVCYKEGTLPTPGENACGGKCDPTTEWTGLWRDGCSFPNDNACKPENALTGEISWDGTTGTIMVPDTYKSLRFWRNTSVATLAAGKTASMTPGTLGYEWDWEQYQSSYPPGRITMSNTSFDGHVHKLSFYKSTAGGLIFGAGSVQWSWGLDANHDSNEQGGGGAATVAMQQATINLFADMGVQPASIQTGLTAATASSDVTPPVTNFTAPANGTTFTSLSAINFSGTATDAGGVVAGVEISFDGGATWAAATGTTSWTYSWTPAGNGTFTVIVRGIDDSGNYTATASSPSISITVNATAQNCPCTIFGTAAPTPTVTVDNDNSGGIVVGTKFRSALSGTVTGIRFYKASGNSGTHQGLLYNNTGTLLAQATFTGETTTGWQQVSFSSPVNITAGTTYIAAYFSSSGNYSSTNGYFSQAKVNSPLTGLADGTDGTNGVYIYASAPAFPINSYQQGNYWVDAVFTNTTTITANAGINQTITLPISTVTLNGSASTGVITSYAWTLISGPNTPTITTPTTVSTTVTGLIQGTYIFKLSVNGGASTAQVTIQVNPVPPPIAKAGPKQTVTLPTSTVNLDGSGSTGTISSYAWTLVSGPNTPSITTPTTVQTTVTGLIQGTYIFQLALNGTVSTANDTVIVNAAALPVAKAGPKQTITLPTSTVALDGSGSTGTISSYTWSLISGPNSPSITTPTTAKTTVTGLIQGTYIFQLALNGTVSTANDTVIVNAAAPPVANAGGNQTITLPVSTVTLNGSGSTGTITSYSWTRISGPNTPVITTPAAVSTTVTGLIQGTYVFQLSLNAGTSVSSTTVNVAPASTSTTIFTTQTPAGSTENDGLALELGVKFRTSAAGSITGIRFYKTSGNSGTHTGELYSSTGTRLAQAVFTGETATGWQQVLFSSPIAITAGTTYIAAYFSSSGGYVSTTNYFTKALVDGQITALADGTDGSNGVYKYSTTPAFPSSTYQKSNYWVDAVFTSAPVAPIANAGANQIITLPASTVTLNGSSSTGTISSYSWTLVSGPNTPIITTPTAVSTTVSGLIQGTYIFQLALNGAVSTSQVTVTVNAAQPVVANAGSNQTITMPASSVTLNGSGSTGVISSYSWTLVSGPNTPVITTTTTVSTNVTGLIQGTYIFQLALNGAVSTSQVTVTVNAAPSVVANAGTNQTIILPASSVTLNGSGSTGTISSYGWTLISGPNAPNIATPSTVSTLVTGLIQGTYIFQLSLNAGASVSQVTVNVVPSVASSTIFTTQTPSVSTTNDGIGIETGVKFRSSVGGMITGVRFYKKSGNTGTHLGELYSSIGTRLAQATYTNETSTGWQTVLFSSPVPITAGVTYIAAYYSSSGNYLATDNYFNSAVVNAPLTALADGTDGPNGVFVYGNFAAFPVDDGSKTNYWVDVVFNGAVNNVDVTPPGILVTSPPSAATNISANSTINVFFNEQINPATISGNTVFLQNGTTSIASSVINNTEGGVTLTPAAPLNPNTVYTMTVKGGTGANKITDVAGNALAKDTVWNFTTGPKPATVIPANGPGGPILLISSGSNAFSRYPVEILRAEGWNAFNALDISAVTTTEINKYDVVVVGDITLTAAQVTMLTTWVTAGGTLIAFHPDPQLSALLGITSAGGTLSDKYLLVNTSVAPGLGIVNQTIQYHGPANLYNVNTGTNIVATLYSDATTATIYPAVTSRNVGTLGGQAIAFTYDLAKSIVYTRQGNPAWAGENRDGQDAVIRADNLFFGNASFDPEPDWVNLNKVAIPQADEQQRLLTNIIVAGNFDHKPLPRFWFLPKGKKAAVVMTGDDHANGGTVGRFNKYLASSSSNTPNDVANWNAIRSTSYMYPFSPITNAQIAMYQNQGFELAFHLNPNCSVWTPTDLQNYFDGQMSDFTNEFYVANALATHRIHCLSWSDWATLPKTEVQLGIRLNVSYYYWPGSWINNRPGMFTGSGMPMRFADSDGSLIDSYQVPSQMTDESGQAYPMTIDSLLRHATGAQGYYGVFCANMHTDDSVSSGSDAIIASAQALQVPVVSSKQMLDWLDARNNSTFSNYTWSNGTLGFTVTQDPKALNLKGMLPQTISVGSFISLTQNGLAVNTTTETIKGISYVFFDAGSGNYVATYAVTAPGGGNNAALVQITPTADSASTNFQNYLGQNYPNPFSLNTRINYSIAASNVVELILYDMQGRPVKIMVNEVKAAGNYIYDLNTGNLAKGVYFYRIRSGSFMDVKKLIID
jgi:hypothetical protein